MKRAIPFLLLLLAACGQSSPSPNQVAIAPKPKPPVEVDTTPTEAPNAHWPAMDAIKEARTAKAAREARALYTGTVQAETLDTMLERKLAEFDFAEYQAVAEQLKKTATPAAAKAAAKQYEGTRYKDDLDRTLKAHIKALIDKDPSLGLPVKSHAAELINLFKGCTTETEAAAALEGYGGDASDSELQAALELWRWGNPEIVREIHVNLAWSFTGRYTQLSDGRLVLGDLGSGDLCLIKPDGSIQERYKIRDVRNLNFIGVSPDEKYLYGASDRGLTVHKWDISSGDWENSFAKTDEGVLMKAVYTTLVPDGKSVFTINSINRPRLWDTETGAELAVLPTIRGMTGAHFSRDGSTGFFGSNGQVLVVNMASNGLVSTVDKPNLSVSSITPSHDGKQFAVLSSEGKEGAPLNWFVSLFDTGSGVELGRVKLAGTLLSMHWLPSGKHLLAYSGTHLMLIDADKKEIVYDHAIPEGGAGISVLSRDGKTLCRHTEPQTKDGKLETVFYNYGRRP